MTEIDIKKVTMFKKKKIITNFPTHIAFIMDGNRRWAVQRGLNKVIGHKQGAAVLKNTIEQVSKFDEIKYVSFFAFSTDNWKREQREIDYIFSLAHDLIKDFRQKFIEQNMKFVPMGDLSSFPVDLQEDARSLQKETENNTGLVVNLALNYGGREDIVRACKEVAKNHEEFSIDNLKSHLYCPVDIDLLVRTSGEMRISNFMLFQLAYSEIYFTKTYWPDFDEKELLKSLENFSKRNRRFGGN